MTDAIDALRAAVLELAAGKELLEIRCQSLRAENERLRPLLAVANDWREAHKSEDREDCYCSLCVATRAALEGSNP